jgi:cation:H+ antiporter
MEPFGLTHAILFVVAGLVVLAGGGEVLVRGAINASRLLKIAPVVIGLTVVALATSLPELAVSLLAAMRGSPDVAIGNVVGSNMFNIAVIIGLAAILFPPLTFRSPKLRFDVAVMIAAAAALIALGWNGFVGRLEGIALMVGLAVFLWIRVSGARAGDDGKDDLEAEAQRAIRRHGSKSRGVFLSVVLIFVGAGLLTGGAELLVRGAIVLAREAGVSERVIAITLVSAGTGLPELATAIVAGIRRQTSVAIGNVIGSNIFNVFGILGTVALVSPIPASSRIIHQDGFWMVGLSLAVLVPILKRNRRMSRLEGVVLLAVYAVYIFRLFW